jgi:predicted membrane protein
MTFQYFHHFLAYFWRYFRAPLGQVSITLTTVATSTSSGMIHGLRFRLKSLRYRARSSRVLTDVRVKVDIDFLAGIGA